MKFKTQVLWPKISAEFVNGQDRSNHLFLYFQNQEAQFLYFKHDFVTYYNKKGANRYLSLISHWQIKQQ